MPVTAQSLGEVARLEETRRKSIKTEGKVYTNKDLGDVPSAASPAPVPPPTTSATPSKDQKATPGTDTSETSATETTGTPTRDQLYWSGRMKDLRETVERNQTYLDALQSRINALTTDFVNRDDPAQRATIAADRNRAAAELERLTVQIQTDRKAITDLEEEARRASVPPGWLR